MSDEGRVGGALGDWWFNAHAFVGADPVSALIADGARPSAQWQRFEGGAAMRRLGAFTLMVVVAVALVLPAPVHAQAPRLIGEPRVENRFPDGLEFVLEAESGVEIRDVRLRYTFLPENRSASAQPEYDKGTRVRASYTLRSGGSGPYMPPGKSIRYSWELVDAAGNALKTPERDTAFSDTRFDWQTATDGLVKLYYYRGSPKDAEALARAARETIDKASALMGTSFDFDVRMWVYATQRDFLPAIAKSSAASDTGVLGQAHEPDTFIMMVDRLASPTALDTARHELTHLVTAQALRGGTFKDLYPSWLSEGASVYFQADPNDVGYIDGLQVAIKQDKVLPPRLLTSSMRSRDVNLFYGESYALVKWLVESQGADKFARMIEAFKQNGDEDQTFQQVYGFDRNGLYQQWRRSVGLPAVQASANTPASAPTPARAATSSTTDQGRPASAPAAKQDGNTTLVLVIAGTSILLILLIAGGVGGLYLASRSRRGGQ